MAQNLDPNLNDPKQNLSRNLNDVDASNDDLGENTEQTPVARAQEESGAEKDERIDTVIPDEDDGINTRNDSENLASLENDERIPTVTPFNENGIAGPDDDDEDDDDTLLDDDDDDDDDDYEEIIPIEGDDDDLEDEYDDDDDDDDDEIEDRSRIKVSRIAVI